MILSCTDKIRLNSLNESIFVESNNAQNHISTFATPLLQVLVQLQSSIPTCCHCLPFYRLYSELNQLVYTNMTFFSVHMSCFTNLNTRSDNGNHFSLETSRPKTPVTSVLALFGFLCEIVHLSCRKLKCHSSQCTVQCSLSIVEEMVAIDWCLSRLQVPQTMLFREAFCLSPWLQRQTRGQHIGFLLCSSSTKE